jgi:hypothetical protein
MAKHIKAAGDWINSVRIQRNLLRPKEDNSVDLKPCWAQISDRRVSDGGTPRGDGSGYQ